MVSKHVFVWDGNKHSMRPPQPPYHHCHYLAWVLLPVLRRCGNISLLPFTTSFSWRFDHQWSLSSTGSTQPSCQSWAGGKHAETQRKKPKAGMAWHGKVAPCVTDLLDLQGAETTQTLTSRFPEQPLAGCWANPLQK